MQEQYEAGSVMKIIPMAAALDLGVARRTDVVNCGHGRIQWKGITIKDHHPYGNLTFDGVLLKSSNPGVIRFADRVGRENFYAYLDRFGFGKRTGFPLPREASGLIAGRGNNQNFASATYGYSVSVSPLQIAMAYGVLANGGTLMKATPDPVSDRE
jgi:cell division protein FtsI/penicillin-binding protein 2